MDLGPALIAGIGPVLVLLVLHRLGNVRHANLRQVALALVWGGVAFYAALKLNTLIYRHAGLSTRVVVDVVAPLVEEVVKAVLIVWLVRSGRVASPTTCLFLGFASGIGFSLCENLFYVSHGAGVEPSLIRVGSTTLMHASSTALIGLAVLRARSPKPTHNGWVDRHPRVAAIRAGATVILRLGFLRVALKGVALHGVLLKAVVSGEQRHTAFNVLVDRPVSPGVIASAVGLGLVFLASTLVTTRRLARVT